MKTRNAVLWIVVTLVGCRAVEPLAAGEIDLDRYAWEFPMVTDIRGAEDLIEELREEVQAVIKAGHLAPLNCRYGDLMPAPAEAHFLYQEPGRIITTLAWAYPHLTSAQQAAVREYVAAELADDRFAPWSERVLPKDLGARREFHPMERVWGADVGFGSRRPRVQTLYGLWLYAFRSGDWTLVGSYWEKTCGVYARRAEEGSLYGTMCAHIGIARLAGRLGDEATRAAALRNLQIQLEAGRNFPAIEDWCRTNYYREYYTARNANGLALHHGAMFLNLSPELGRYLHDHVQESAWRRHREGVARFPFWWLRQAPYFCRWTGDESVGLSPEVIGMIAPLERWLVEADAGTLRRYTASVPTGRGDCYWIEMLTQAIEAHGRLTWTDVRRTGRGP